jgi:hypothetical protein
VKPGQAESGRAGCVNMTASLAFLAQLASKRRLFAGNQRPTMQIRLI